MLALDTDVLVHWALADAPFHAAAAALIEKEIHGGGRIALTPQVCWAFLHVITDDRRVDGAPSMDAAVALVRRWWSAPETEQVLPTPAVLARALALVLEHRLGRKRILDTALAATLEAAGIRRLATLNGRDYLVFPFIQVVDLR
jgi:predicted nucleic acid-binding protein